MLHQEVPGYPTPLYYPGLPYSPAFTPLQCARPAYQVAKPTAKLTTNEESNKHPNQHPHPQGLATVGGQAGSLARPDSPPRPPGELPDWQLGQVIQIHKNG